MDRLLLYTTLESSEIQFSLMLFLNIRNMNRTLFDFIAVYIYYYLLFNLWMTMATLVAVCLSARLGAS